MPDYTTETRTFVGETATAIGDGYAGWRLGRQYQVRYRQTEDGRVAVALDHEHCRDRGLEMTVSEGQFGKWFRG